MDDASDGTDDSVIIPSPHVRSLEGGCSPTLVKSDLRVVVVVIVTISVVSLSTSVPLSSVGSWFPGGVESNLVAILSLPLVVVAGRFSVV